MRPSNSGMARHVARCVRISSWPGSSAGCALPANRNSTGRSASPSDAAQPVEVVEQQRRALVGGEAPREADGEHVRVRRDRRSAAGGRGAPRCRGCGSAAAPTRWRTMCSMRAFSVLAHAPEDVVGDVADLLPDAGMAEAVHPADAEEALEHLAPLRREEGRHVHAVGDVAERVLLGRDLRPEVLQHAAPRRRRGCARRRSGSASRGWRARSC